MQRSKKRNGQALLNKSPNGMQRVYIMCPALSTLKGELKGAMYSIGRPKIAFMQHDALFCCAGVYIHVRILTLENENILYKRNGK
jgi:hypothetical protein